jgi:NAD(P)H dehydrogenase (quinone)
MRCLIVYCHPNPQSFSAALRDRVILGLTHAGHEMRVVDLYAEGFNPVLSAQERADYHTHGVNEQNVAEHLTHLRWCEGIIFVFPTWWYGPPAMLKGWLDRVWVPHATFEMPQGLKPVGRVLTNIRLVSAVSTLGSPWWWWKLGMGEPGRKILLKGMSMICNLRCKTLWLALHQIDSKTPEKRTEFLNKVEKAFKALK